MDLGAAWRHLDLVVVFLVMLVFDTVGTLIGVSEQAGLAVDGRLPRADRAMVADAVGTLAGAALGTSTVSSYIESASGVAEGARTGLANVLTAALFLAALFFAPLVAMVGGGVSVAGAYYYPGLLVLSSGGRTSLPVPPGLVRPALFALCGAVAGLAFPQRYFAWGLLLALAVAWVLTVAHWGARRQNARRRLL